MIGLDPNGTPKNKASLLAASFLTGIFGAAFMLLLLRMHRKSIHVVNISRRLKLCH